jgi:PAS domain S-box-containing protein
LLESEQRLRFVLKGSGLGFWDWKIDSHKVEINTIKTEVFRYHYAKIQAITPQWLNFIYLDDQEKVWQSIQDVLNGKRATHQIEYRVIDKAGDVHWILDHANIVQRDQDGKPTLTRQ